MKRYVVAFLAVLALAPSSWGGDSGRVARDAAILKSAGLSDKVLKIEKSPIPGFDAITLHGGRVMYVSRDGQQLIEGRLITQSPQGAIDATAPMEMRARVEILEALPPSHYISYRPKGELRSYITVFTDTGCPFCQLFHKEVPALLAAGVGVRYLPYPRGGDKSEDFEHLTGVWCAKDRQDALEKGLRGRKVPRLDCPASAVVRQGFELGRDMGVKGTPTIVMADGSIVTGTRDAATLIKALGLSK